MAGHGVKDDLLAANRVVLDESIRRWIQGTVDDSSRVIGRVVLEKGAAATCSDVGGLMIIGAGTEVKDAFIGPYTSVGRRCNIQSSVLEHCVVLDGVTIEGAVGWNRAYWGGIQPSDA